MRPTDASRYRQRSGEAREKIATDNKALSRSPGPTSSLTSQREGQRPTASNGDCCAGFRDRWAHNLPQAPPAVRANALMSAAATVPWPQQLLGCFGGPAVAIDLASPDKPASLREDSALNSSGRSSGGSGILTRSHKSRRNSSPPPLEHFSFSEPPPRRKSSAAARQPCDSRRFASRPRVDRQSGRSYDRSGKDLKYRDRHSGAASDSPRSTHPEDVWHSTKRFAFVGDISCKKNSVTKLMQNRKTQELVAVKFIERSPRCIDNATETELLNHRRLDSDHVVRLKEVFLTDTHLAVVTEHCPGGPLFRHVVHRGRLAESDARRFFRQLVAGIAYCHSRGVYHRDLKLDSLRLDATDNLRIGDFGYCSTKLTATGECADVRDPAASAAYAPPEVLLGHSIVNANYDGEVLDIWSAGIILYVMVFGDFPFEDSAGPRSVRTTVKRIVRLQYEFPSAVQVSDEVKDLLSRIFVANKAKRIDLAGIAGHPWTTEGGRLKAVPIPSPTSTPAGSPTKQAPQMDLLTGDDTFHGFRTASLPQAPESPPAAGVRRISTAALFGRRTSLERAQTDAEIAVVVRKVLAKLQHQQQKQQQR